MDVVYQASLTSEMIKSKARELGADLVGIADGQKMNDNPPDLNDPRRPCDISDYDANRAIVLGKRINSGTTRLLRWNERHKYYNDELTLTRLEEISLELALWLEEEGYPALIVPPTHVDPWKYLDNPKQHQTPLLSATHAAVEAGLGTLGLNQQLLTPEFGPRVMLIVLLCSVDVEPDQRMEEALCLGPSCGRCLQSCPGDVIGHWDRNWEACDRYRSPHGFHHVADFLEKVLDEPDVQKQKEMIRSEDSFNIWQSTLRGAGVVTGCRRCQDVCPVGADYEAMLKDALDEIPEDTSEKRQRLEKMIVAEREDDLPNSYHQQKRWIGTLQKTSKN